MGNLSKAEQHFYDHSGWSWDPATQTTDEGRIENAKELAAAEQWGLDGGCHVRWEDDPWNWAHGETVPDTCEIATVYDRLSGESMNISLCGILNATPEYRRVIEAELMRDLIHELNFRPDRYRGRHVRGPAHNQVACWDKPEAH